MVSSWALVFCAALSLPACADDRYPAPEQTPLNDVFEPTGPETNSKEEWSIRLALDDTHVYWSTLGGGVVRRALKTGGPAVTLNDPVLNLYPSGLAVDAERVYFGSTYAADLVSVPKAGGANTWLLQDDESTGMYEVAVDDAYVYAALHDDPRLRRLPKNGGDAEILSLEGKNATSIALDGEHVYWAVDITDYVAETAIKRAPKAGGATELIAGGVDDHPVVAIDDTHAYWVSMDSCRVQRAPKEGGAPATLADGLPDGHCAAISVDETHVYWAMAFDVGEEPAGVWRVAKAGGAPTRVATERNVYGLALDDAHVYFSSGTTFRRVPK